MPVIHVTGTNGKGSVVAMLRRLLMANGVSVGTYTSPHLERPNERIGRDGVPISDEDLAEALGGVAAVEPLLGRPCWRSSPRRAFRWFAGCPDGDRGGGVAGPLRRTNVVTADVAVVMGGRRPHRLRTRMGARVAQEKAGIVTPGRPVVLGDVGLLGRVRVEGARPVLALGRDFEVLRPAWRWEVVCSTCPVRGELPTVCCWRSTGGTRQPTPRSPSPPRRSSSDGPDDEVLTEAFADIEGSDASRSWPTSPRGARHGSQP
ncbi:MAG: hypothetical protein R2716_00890 [Microthrixaceae bacterium]